MTRQVQVGFVATVSAILAALALQYGSSVYAPLPDGGQALQASLADGGPVFPDGGFCGAVYVTGINANTSGLSFPTCFGNDGGLVTVRVQSLLLNRQGMDTWGLGHYNDGGPDWAYAIAEFQAYPAVLADGGVDLAQMVSLSEPPGMWVEANGANDGDFLQMGAPLYPQYQVTFIGMVGTVNSVPFPCACSPRPGTGPGPYCVVAVAQPDGGQWNLGTPGQTYGAGQWFPDAGCESKACFQQAGIGPTSMPSDCWFVDGGGQ